VRSEIERAIAEGAAQLRSGLPDGGAAKLADYVQLLAKWNAKINLTAVRDPAQMVTHHILDCLAAVPEIAKLAYSNHRTLTPNPSPLEGEGSDQPSAQVRLADVGTGAGLPGLVIALAQPQMQVTCIDTVEKKIAFVQQAIGVLGLKNAKAVASRTENLQESFDVVTCRAFASLVDMVAMAGHLLKPDGLLLAMKGPKAEEEAAALPAGWLFLGAIELVVPGLNEERKLAVIRKAMTNDFVPVALE
jgi:16S rRNA (guanine527-N7)-methyltransferase